MAKVPNELEVESLMGWCVVFMVTFLYIETPISTIVGSSMIPESMVPEFRTSSSSAQKGGGGSSLNHTEEAACSVHLLVCHWEREYTSPHGMCNVNGNLSKLHFNTASPITV